MRKKAKPTTPPLHRVSLQFQLPYASSVLVAGSFPFSNWDASGVPLAPDGAGGWSVELELPSGRYEYRLIVDGQWADVPQPAQTVDNTFGGRNAVLVVGALN